MRTIFRSLLLEQNAQNSMGIVCALGACVLLFHGFQISCSSSNWVLTGLPFLPCHPTNALLAATAVLLMAAPSQIHSIQTQLFHSLESWRKTRKNEMKRSPASDYTTLKLNHIKTKSSRLNSNSSNHAAVDAPLNSMPLVLGVARSFKLANGWIGLARLCACASVVLKSLCFV